MIAARIARRDMRGGLRHVRAALVGLAVGVAAIAGVGSLHRAFEAGLEDGGRAILGGDAAFRLAIAPATEAERDFLDAAGRVSAVVELYAMAAAMGGESVLAAVKAVDGAYPLYGAVRLDPPMPIAEALAARDGSAGVVAAPGLALRLGVAPGDRLRLGGAEVELRAILVEEPDRASAPFLLADRLIAGPEAIAAAGLLQPGSLARYAYRVRLPEGVDPEALVAEARSAFPEAGWQAVTASAANPQLGRFIDRLAVYLTLAGQGALLIGAIGVASAVATYMARKTETVAILKTLGGASGLVLRVLLLEVLALVVVGVGVGLGVGAAVPFIVAGAARDLLPLPLAPGLHAAPLALAALFGLLAAAAFALWPVLAARRVPAASLFRRSSGDPLRAPLRDRAVALAAPVGLASLAVAASGDAEVAAWFVAGAAAAFGLFRLVAVGLGRAGRRLARATRGAAKLALQGLARPGAPAGPVLLALGLGLSLMVMIVTLEASLRAELGEAMPREAPSFFFLDLQGDQLDRFAALVAAAPGGRIIDRVPALRGRITRIDGVPVDRATVGREAQWAIQSDRGVTYADVPPPGGTVSEGSWWPAGYAGPPLLSLDEGIARGFGIGVGDRLTVNVLGREIEAEIANLRRIDWDSLGMNFTLVLTPKSLEGAPHTHIATVRVDPGAEPGLRAAVARELPNVSAVAVREVLARVVAMLDQIGLVFRAAAGVTLVIGVVVLAEATAASQRRRLYDALVLKVLGATRRQVMTVFVVEYLAMGAAVGVLAGLVGWASAWALATRLLEVPAAAPAGAIALVLAGGLAAIGLFGFLASFRALGAGTAPLLRVA